jgi:hypothetical protein
MLSLAPNKKALFPLGLQRLAIWMQTTNKGPLSRPINVTSAFLFANPWSFIDYSKD